MNIYYMCTDILYFTIRNVKKTVFNIVCSQMSQNVYDKSQQCSPKCFHK